LNRVFRLGPVLRARKAQEDVARGAVVQSRAEVREAAALVKRRQLELTGGDAPSEGTARAMVASMVARQSLAAGLSAAHRMVAEADEQVAEKVAELADAAKRRRAVEMMAERHAEAVRGHDLAVDQRSIDELAVTAKARSAARGVDAVTERRSNAMRHSGAVDRSAAEHAAAARAAANRAVIDLAAANRSITGDRSGAAHPAAELAADLAAEHTGTEDATAAEQTGSRA
jgi:flagellar export protein FliJ